MVYPNGDRRIVVKPNMFYTDRAEIWAEEMADSVDMFGWDGCRWDWGFIPNAVCDPLYHESKADEWYNQDGVATSKLFPDPDTTGEACLKAWRKVMERRHPNFIYGTNYSSSANSWSMTPKYHKEASRNAVVLFEDMLGFNREVWNTFEKWGEELALRTDLVRPQNAAPVVGSMRGVSAGSVSARLAHYTCAAAGNSSSICFIGIKVHSKCVRIANSGNNILENKASVSGGNLNRNDLLVGNTIFLTVSLGHVNMTLSSDNALSKFNLTTGAN
jgi:hypothetical protein